MIIIIVYLRVNYSLNAFAYKAQFIILRVVDILGKL